MDTKIIEWLLEDNSWLRFAVETQLLGKKAEPSLATADSKIQVVICSAPRCQDTICNKYFLSFIAQLTCVSMEP